MQCKGHHIGATLTETLIGVVLAMSAVGLVAVASGGTRGDAMSAMDAANLMTMAGASSMYQADHNGWLVGAPGTSGRELLNDANAAGGGLALDVSVVPTQPFDWASPLIPYLAPKYNIPQRRDERFALLNGTAIPDYNAPDFDPLDVDLTPSGGPLAAFADPAQDEVSVPYLDSVLPGGIAGTAFQPQLAYSYIAAREFLWNARHPGAGLHIPRWAGSSFWGGPGTLYPTSAVAADLALPGASSRNGHHPAYRPSIHRIGDPSAKVFLANGTRYQAESLAAIDHDVQVAATFGGAFTDTGAWNVRFTRTWPMGSNAAGQDMSSISFRRGGTGENAMGHVMYFDNSIELLTMHDARRPERWVPRGTALRIGSIDESLQPEYADEAILLQYIRMP